MVMTAESRAATVEMIKKNVASISVTLTFITAIVGGAFTVESRYAKADDVKDLRSYVQQSREYDRWDQRQLTNQSRKQQLEDQLFILRLKQHPNQQDQALIEHYQDQLNELAGQLNAPAPPLPK